MMMNAISKRRPGLHAVSVVSLSPVHLVVWDGVAYSGDLARRYDACKVSNRSLLVSAGRNRSFAKTKLWSHSRNRCNCCSLTLLVLGLSLINCVVEKLHRCLCIFYIDIGEVQGFSGNPNPSKKSNDIA